MAHNGTYSPSIGRGKSSDANISIVTFVEWQRSTRRIGGMNSGGHLVRWLAVALGAMLLAAKPIVPRQNAGETQASEAAPQGGSGDASKAAPQAQQQSSPPGNPQDATQDSSPDAPKTTPTAQEDPVPHDAPVETPKENPKPRPSGDHAYALSASYSVDLPAKWNATDSNQIPPPAPLGPYAPPIHLAGNLVLSDAELGAILQFATSNNAFLGHDSYWLDTQIHSPSGSGMSLLDFFFYYFFPPSDACMHQVLTTYADASRVAPTGETPSYMQVYYACPTSDTLSGFYSAQVSSGITFRLTDDGTRVLAPVGDFYVAPMEEVHTTGMTFFVFEAQGLSAVSSEATQRFHFPSNAQGGPPDFFWAIGAATPFPFVADADRKDVAILHVAYARLGVGPDPRAEFLDILHNIDVR
jgi:hypothetical protein